MVMILLATLNSENYLEPLLQSILNQSYQDIKIVIRDNGSDDSTPQIIARYLEIYSDKIELCPTSSIARSTSQSIFSMLEQYSADYIMLCEGKNIWQPKEIETALKAMQNAERELSSGTPILVATNLNFEAPSQADTQLKTLLMQNLTKCATIMINSSLKEKLFAFPDTEHYGWWLSVVAAAFGYVILNDNGAGKKYISNKKGFIAALREEVDSTQLFADFLLENYADGLDFRKRRLLEAVSDLYTMERIKRIKTVKKYGLTRGSVVKDIFTLL